MTNTLTSNLYNLMHFAPAIIIGVCAIGFCVATIFICRTPKRKIAQIDPAQWKGGK
jgi:hypothetical protein